MLGVLADTLLVVAETLVVVADTLVAVADTLVAAHDTLVTVADAQVAVEDALVVAHDTLVTVADTFLVAHDTFMVVADAQVAVADTSLVAHDTFMAVANTFLVAHDTVIVVADTQVAVADTFLVAHDTLIAVADAQVPVADTFLVAHDTLIVVADAQVAVADTFLVAHDTLVAVEDEEVVTPRTLLDDKTLSRLACSCSHSCFCATYGFSRIFRFSGTAHTNWWVEGRSGESVSRGPHLPTSLWPPWLERKGRIPRRWRKRGNPNRPRGSERKRAMTTKNDKPGRTENALLAIRKGAEVVLAGGKTFPYMGKSYDLAGFQQLVDTFLTPFTNAREQHTLLSTAVSSREANDPAAKEFVRLCEFASASTYGESSLEFSQMGFKPRKKAAELTPEQKQLKLERTRATRAARHVMGSRQKRNVKGVVTPDAGATGNTATPPAGGTTAAGGSNTTAKP